MGLYIMPRMQIVTDYYITKYTRSDAKHQSTELIDCKINRTNKEDKSKALVKTQDGYYLSLLEQLEVFLRSCSLVLSNNKLHDPRAVMLTIWFKDGASISDYFRQVRSHMSAILKNKGLDHANPILYYHGQQEKHSKAKPLHHHFVIIFDSNQLRDTEVRKALQKPIKYCRVIESKSKLPHVSTKDKPYQTDGSVVGTNALQVHSIKRNLPKAIQHFSYFCKVNQKENGIVSKKPCTSQSPTLNKQLKVLGIDKPSAGLPRFH